MYLGIFCPHCHCLPCKWLWKHFPEVWAIVSYVKATPKRKGLT